MVNVAARCRRCLRCKSAQTKTWQLLKVTPAITFLSRCSLAGQELGLVTSIRIVASRTLGPAGGPCGCSFLVRLISMNSDVQTVSPCLSHNDRHVPERPVPYFHMA